jgi:hypothetical protein
MTYVIYACDSEIARTECPVEAVSLALSQARKVSDENQVCVWQTGVYGQYHENPGSAYRELYDWRRAVRELMG